MLSVHTHYTGHVIISLHLTNSEFEFHNVISDFLKYKLNKGILLGAISALDSSMSYIVILFYSKSLIGIFINIQSSYFQYHKTNEPMN